MVKPFLSENACFFTFLNNKSKTCGWQFLFVCYFTCQAQKIPFIAILTWVLILGKIEDGDHCWWRHLPSAAPPPIKYTSSCWEDQRLSTKGKIVSKYCNRSKTLSSTPPHPTFIPPLYHSGGMSLRVRLRVKLLIKSSVGRKNQKSNHLIKLPIFY